MMRKELVALSTIMLFGLVQYAFGHGLGLETVNANVGGQNVALTVQINPTEFSPESEKTITISLEDARGDQDFQDVLFHVSLSHSGKTIFEEDFFAEDGLITININEDPESLPEIRGEFDEEIQAWLIGESSPAELTGDVFYSGGIHHFEIIVKEIGGSKIEDHDPIISDITLTTNHTFLEQSREGRDVSFGIKSYYDLVSDFDYDPNTNTITFEMPFDWSEQNISHVMVVHEEVHFPKDFGDLFVPSYEGMVNGVELFKSSVTVDDYTIADERIVHFVLSQDNLRYLKQAQKSAGVESPQNLVFTLKASDKVVFPVIAMTRNEEVQVDLSWDPITIEPEKSTRFIFTFRDARTGEPIRDTTYDFVLEQNGDEVFRKSGNARIGGDYADYTFSQGQTGQTSIKFENIGGKDLRTEFGVIVVPEFGPVVMLVLSLSVVLVIVLGKRTSVLS